MSEIIDIMIGHQPTSLAEVQQLCEQMKALRDERDRLQLHIKSLGGRFKRLDAFLANGRTVEAHQLVKNTIEALEKIEAALTPAKGVQQHPAFDEYGEHRQPTGLGDL